MRAGSDHPRASPMPALTVDGAYSLTATPKRIFASACPIEGCNQDFVDRYHPVTLTLQLGGRNSASVLAPAGSRNCSPGWHFRVARAGWM